MYKRNSNTSNFGGGSSVGGSDVESNPNDNGYFSGDDIAAAHQVVPLEETMGDVGLSKPTHSPVATSSATVCSKLNAKKVISSAMMCFIVLVIYDSIVTAPEDRLLQPNVSQKFLGWVQAHPGQGLLWIVVTMAMAVIFMIPIGTPITVGCGYIYKGAYGWTTGVFLATVVSMAGSALGAVICFVLGRYLMRDTVKKWIRKYPLFDAIDAASAEHGLRIMMMLYLTPILPLGPVSYMCGTTRMLLSHFVIAKVAALPLMMLYVFIGASTGTLMTSKSSKQGQDVLSTDQMQNIEENQFLIVLGIVLSFVSIAVVTHSVRQELHKILERQKRQQDEVEGGDKDALSASNSSNNLVSNDGEGTNSLLLRQEPNNANITPDGAAMEMTSTTARQRQRKH